MSKNSAAHQKKVESAMRIFQTTTGQRFAGHDTGWIFEIGRCKWNHAPGGKALPVTKARQSTHGPTVRGVLAGGMGRT
jgi:hypothetical protein